MSETNHTTDAEAFRTGSAAPRNEKELLEKFDEAERVSDRLRERRPEPTVSQSGQLHDRVERDFQYHPPKGDQPQKYVFIRDKARQLAHDLVDLVPPGRELSLALTKLEECVMMANAGIARHG